MDGEPQLLARDRELAQLDAAVARVAEGRGGCVVIEGIPGSGRSSLLAAAVARAGRRGLATAAVRATLADPREPFGVALRLLDERLRMLPAAARDELLGRCAALADDGSAAASAASGRGQAAQLGGEAAIGRELRWLLADRAADQPLLIAIDDADGVDGPTARWLRALASGSGRLAVAVCVAALPARSDGLIADLLALPDTVSLRPGPLPQAAIATLLGQAAPSSDAGAHAAAPADDGPARPTARRPDPPADAPRDAAARADGDALAAAVAAATGGRPGLVAAAVAAIADRDDDPLRWLAGAAAPPPALIAAARAPLRRLSPQARTLARAAALLADEATGARGARLAQLAPAAADAAFAELRRAGVAGGDGRVAPPLLRRALADDATADDGGRMRLAAARTLADRPEAAGRQLLAAPVGGGEEAVALLRTAADRAAGAGDHAHAARLLARALAESPQGEVALEVVIALAEAEAAQGRDDAAAPIDRALADGALCGRSRARGLLAAGRLHHDAGRTRAAFDAFAAGLAALEDDPEPALEAELRAHLTTASFWTVERRRAPGPEPLERAIGGAPPPPARRRLLAQTALELALRGEQRERLVALALQATASGALLDDGPFGLLADRIATAALIVADALDDADRIAGAHIARVRDDPATAAPAWWARAYARRRAGRVAAALADARPAVELGERVGHGNLPLARSELALTLLARGDVEAAAAALPAADAIDAAGDGEDPTTQIRAGEAVAAVALARGEAAAALELLLAAGERWAAVGAVNPAVSGWQAAASAAALRLGSRALARQLARDALERARAFGAPRAVAVALGATAAAADTPEERVALLREAVVTIDGSPARLTQAQARVALGEALAETGATAGVATAGLTPTGAPAAGATAGSASGAAASAATAAGELRAGHELALRCGALGLAARARAALAEVGGGRAAAPRPAGARDRPATAAGGATRAAAGLSDAAAPVVALAVEGRTNREIAAALHLSEKTVEFHLRNAYRALGIRSRHQLAQALADARVAEIVAGRPRPAADRPARG